MRKQAVGLMSVAGETRMIDDGTRTAESRAAVALALALLLAPLLTLLLVFAAMTVSLLCRSANRCASIAAVKAAPWPLLLVAIACSASPAGAITALSACMGLLPLAPPALLALLASVVLCVAGCSSFSSRCCCCVGSWAGLGCCCCRCM